MRRQCHILQIFCQCFGTMVNTKALQKRALWGQTGMGTWRGHGQRLEIHMGGDIGLPRVGQHIHRPMPLQGLQCIAQAAPIAIIHNQRRAAMLGDALANL